MKKQILAIFLVIFLFPILNSQSNERPFALIDKTTQTGYAPFTVTLSGEFSTPQDKIISYAWDMDDGTKLGGEKITHTFEEPGTYIVSMTAITDIGKQGFAFFVAEVLAPKKTQTNILLKDKIPKKPPLQCNENGITGKEALETYGFHFLKNTWKFREIDETFCTPKIFGGKGNYCDSLQFMISLEQKMANTKQSLDEIFSTVTNEEKSKILESKGNEWLKLFKLKTSFELPADIKINAFSRKTENGSNIPISMFEFDPNWSEYTKEDWADDWTVFQNAIKEDLPWQRVLGIAKETLERIEPEFTLDSVILEFSEPLPTTINSSSYVVHTNCSGCAKSFMGIHSAISIYRNNTNPLIREILSQANIIPILIDTEVEGRYVNYLKDVDFETDSLKSLEIFEKSNYFLMQSDNITQNLKIQFSNEYSNNIEQLAQNESFSILDPLNWDFKTDNYEFKSPGEYAVNLTPVFTEDKDRLKIALLQFDISQLESFKAQEKFLENPFFFASLDAGIDGQIGKRDFGVAFTKTNKTKNVSFFTQTNNLDTAFDLTELNSGGKEFEVVTNSEIKKSKFDIVTTNFGLIGKFTMLEPVLIEFAPENPKTDIYYVFEKAGNYLTPKEAFKDIEYDFSELIEWTNSSEEIIFDEYIEDAKEFCPGWDREIPSWKVTLDSSDTGIIKGLLFAPSNVNLAIVCSTATNLTATSRNIEGKIQGQITVEKETLFGQGANSLFLSESDNKKVFSIEGLKKEVEEGKLCLASSNSIEGSGLNFEWNKKLMFRDSKLEPTPTPIPIANIIPDARVADEVISVEAGELIEFDGSNSTGEFFAWDFGDSQVEEGVIVEHSYSKPGTYWVTLKVSNSKGESDTQTVLVAIAEKGRFSQPKFIPSVKPNEKPTVAKGIPLTEKTKEEKDDLFSKAKACYNMGECKVTSFEESTGICFQGNIRDGTVCNNGTGVCQKGTCTTSTKPIGQTGEVFGPPVPAKKPIANEPQYKVSSQEKYSLIAIPVQFSGSEASLKSVARKRYDEFVGATHLSQCKERIGLHVVSKEQASICKFNIDLACSTRDNSNNFLRDLITCAEKLGFNTQRDNVRIIGLTDSTIRSDIDRGTVEDEAVQNFECGETQEIGGYTNWGAQSVLTSTKPEWNIGFSHEIGHTFGFCEQYSSVLYAFANTLLKLTGDSCHNFYPGQIGKPGGIIYSPYLKCPYEKDEYVTNCPEGVGIANCKGRKIPINNQIGRSIMGPGVTGTQRAFDCFEEDYLEGVWSC